MAPLAPPALSAPPNVRGGRHAWRTFLVSYWLGWQVEANWTDPLLFFIYSIVRPLGGVLILVFMYRVIAGGQGGPPLYYFVVGSAVWPLVLNGMQGMSWALIDDRERFHTVRYIYTAPIAYPVYLVGRCLAQTTTALSAVVITLLFGRFALGVPLSVATTNWPHLLVALASGLPAIVGMALLAVVIVMAVSREAWRLPEAIAAALFLVCGVIFPVTVLPAPVQLLSRVVPFTWWLEAVRRALLGPTALSSFPDLSNATVMAWLVVTSLAALAAGLAVYGWGERRARLLGRLDQETAY
jgi:ABC-2 type transport system permease protein